MDNLTDEQVEKMAETVYNNYMNLGFGSNSVETTEIKNLIYKLINIGIEVRITKLPKFETEYGTIYIQTYKISEQYPLDIDSDAHIVYLYQWYQYPKEVTGEDATVLRIATLTRKYQ